MTLPSALKFVARYETREPIFAPQMFGGMFRASLGPALLDVDHGAYRNLFEPAPRPELGSRYKDPPTPLVMEARDPQGGFLDAGERFSINLTLIGEAAVLVAPLIEALRMVGENGLGKTRAETTLLSTECIWRDDEYLGGPAEDAPAVPPMIPPLPKIARVALISPLRRKVDGKQLTERTFTARRWVDAIRERIAVLDAAYGDAPKIDRGPKVPEISIDDVQLWTVEQDLYSSGSDKRRPTSGVMGNFLLPLDGLAEHWPFIWAGQWYQVGARPNIGLGAYRVRPE